MQLTNNKKQLKTLPGAKLTPIDKLPYGIHQIHNRSGKVRMCRNTFVPQHNTECATTHSYFTWSRPGLDSMSYTLDQCFAKTFLKAKGGELFFQSSELFFHGSSSDFCSFSHIIILIVLVCLKLNGK